MDTLGTIGPLEAQNEEAQNEEAQKLNSFLYYFKPPVPSAAASPPPRRAVGAFGPSCSRTGFSLQDGHSPLESHTLDPP